MTLRNFQIPALYNGVSQQPAPVRAPDQCEDQINAWATIAEGIAKRAPSEQVAKVTGLTPPLSSANVHFINRDITQQFAVIVTDGNIKVFDVNDGSEKTVTFPTRPQRLDDATYIVGDVVQSVASNPGFLFKCTVAGTSDSSEPTFDTAAIGNTTVDNTVTWEAVPDYLSSADPESDFALVTVADYTFLINKTVEVRMEIAGTDQIVQNNALRWSPRAGEDEFVGGFKTGGTFQYPANTAGGTFINSVSTFEDLPDSPSNGDIYEVKGSVETRFVSFYVRRNGGAWDETVKPGLVNQPDFTTMPHALVRESNGTFTFAPFSWAPRRVGDLDTNPRPSFVGRTIRDVFFYQNRLGFLSDENVIFSRSGDFGNFFRMTVVDFLESDIVDVATTETNVNILNYAVPFADGVMLFADQTQFSLSHGESGLAVQTVTIRPTTHYEMNANVDPRPLGDDIYFISEGSNFSIMREFFIPSDSDSTSAADVTAHVPRFLPKNVTKLAPSVDNGTVFVLSSDRPESLYVYQFVWVGDSKAQSAWHRWDFDAGDKILSMEVFDENLFLLVERSDAIYLDKIDLTFGALAGGLDMQVFLDRRNVLTSPADFTFAAGYTTITVPYDIVTEADFKVVYDSGHGALSGALVDPSTYIFDSATSVRVPIDLTAADIIVGQNYVKRYEFSQQFMRSRTGAAVTTGRLQLRTFTMFYVDTAFFKTEVKPYGNATSEQTEQIIVDKLDDFTGKTLGDADLILGTPVFQTGSYSFQIYGDSRTAKIAIINDTHVASRFQSAEWEGFHFNRSR